MRYLLDRKARRQGAASHASGREADAVADTIAARSSMTNAAFWSASQRIAAKEIIPSLPTTTSRRRPWATRAKARVLPIGRNTSSIVNARADIYANSVTD